MRGGVRSEEKIMRCGEEGGRRGKGDSAVEQEPASSSMLLDQSCYMLPDLT